MLVISAIAEFERDLLLERTYSGIARARDAGKRFGRQPVLNEECSGQLKLATALKFFQYLFFSVFSSWHYPISSKCSVLDAPLSIE